MTAVTRIRNRVTTATMWCANHQTTMATWDLIQFLFHAMDFFGGLEFLTIKSLKLIAVTRIRTWVTTTTTWDPNHHTITASWNLIQQPFHAIDSFGRLEFCTIKMFKRQNHSFRKHY